jgi:hypothetical protein
MISDTLSDAAAEIRDYLQSHLVAYAPFRAEIEAALAAMDAAREALDQLPDPSRADATDMSLAVYLTDEAIHMAATTPIFKVGE